MPEQMTKSRSDQNEFQTPPFRRSLQSRPNLSLSVNEAEKASDQQERGTRHSPIFNADPKDNMDKPNRFGSNSAGQFSEGLGLSSGEVIFDHLEITRAKTISSWRLRLGLGEFQERHRRHKTV